MSKESKKFSTAWKSSSKPKKQKKYLLNAPLHLKHHFVQVHLSKELRKKYNRRSISVRKGDKVKVMGGSFKKHEGKVESVDLKKMRVCVSGIELTKRDGTKSMPSVHPSKLMITELNTDDKWRQKIIDRKMKVEN